MHDTLFWRGQRLADSLTVKAQLDSSHLTNSRQKEGQKHAGKNQVWAGEKNPPEEFCSSPSKAHHVVGDGTKQQRLYQVVGQLNEALSQGERQFVVHAAGALSVHDATLCEGHRLDSHGVDDAQEKHGQVEATQDVAQVLSRLPAKGEHTVRKWWCECT